MLHTETRGSGSRKLLVIPGWRLDAQTEIPDWSPILRDRPGWQFVFVDLPGTGGSLEATAGISDQRDIVAELLLVFDKLDGERPGWALAGTSNGAALALAVAQARRAQVRGLALRVPMLEPSDQARAEAGQPEWEAAFNALPASYRHAHKQKVARLWEPARSSRTDAEFLMQIRSDPVRYSVPQEDTSIAVIDVPALVVLGRQDAQVGWELAWSTLSQMPRATVAVLDRAGHALPAGKTQRDLWSALVLDWLDRVEDQWQLTT